MSERLTCHHCELDFTYDREDGYYNDHTDLFVCNDCVSGEIGGLYDPGDSDFEAMAEEMTS